MWGFDVGLDQSTEQLRCLDLSMERLRCALVIWVVGGKWMDGCRIIRLSHSHKDMSEAHQCLRLVLVGSWKDGRHTDATVACGRGELASLASTRDTSQS